jgi:hypothetical protein
MFLKHEQTVRNERSSAISQLTIDHSKTISEVYRDETKYLIRESGKIACLRHFNYPEKAQNLLSWAVDWNSDEELKFADKHYEDELLQHSSRFKPVATIQDFSEAGVLKLEGHAVATVGAMNDWVLPHLGNSCTKRSRAQMRLEEYNLEPENPIKSSPAHLSNSAKLSQNGFNDELTEDKQRDTHEKHLMDGLYTFRNVSISNWPVSTSFPTYDGDVVVPRAAWEGDVIAMFNDDSRGFVLRRDSPNGNAKRYRLIVMAWFWLPVHTRDYQEYCDLTSEKCHSHPSKREYYVLKCVHDYRG